MKQKRVPAELAGKVWAGDVWTWTALCADTKLVPAFRVGRRDSENADAFVRDLASRLTHRVQITTDGLHLYLDAVEMAFGYWNVDYAMLVKLYGAEPQNESRYSPPRCIGTRRETRLGQPAEEHVSTSYVERQNLTMRMSMRRFTRLTNAFSKRVENHYYAVALHFMHYNFARIHSSLRVTPAMEAGVSSHVWEVEEIVRLLEEQEVTSR